MKVYIVVELPKGKEPRILDVFQNECDAWNRTLTSKEWCNIIEKEVI